MKKLNLQLDSIKEMLTKEQMKKIVGGYGDVLNQCSENKPCTDPHDWCNNYKCETRPRPKP